MRCIRLLVAMILWLAATRVLALDPSLRFFQYAGGSTGFDVELSTDISDIYQDRQGFLWLATAQGLARHDGIEPIVYRVSGYPELLSNNPKKLFVDSRNRLFVASERGVSIFDGERFQILMEGNKSAAEIHAIEEGSHGTVWLGSDEDLWRLDGETLTTASFATPIRQVQSILWHGDTLFVGSRGVVHVIRGDQQSSIALGGELSTLSVLDIEFHQGQVWGATRGGLFVLEEGVARAVERPELEGVAIGVLFSDMDQNLWFGGPRNFGRFFPDGSLEVPDLVDETVGFSPQITAVYEDSFGRLWHTSRSHGAYFFANSQVRRVSYTEGMVSPNVTALTTDVESVAYIATDSGISAIKQGVASTVVEGDFSAERTVRSIVIDPHDRLWLGTEEGLRIFDLKTSSWLDHLTEGSLDIAINAIVHVEDDVAWLATESGLYAYDGGVITPIIDTSNLSVGTLLLDSRGTLWLGTENGIASFVSGKLLWHASELSPSVGIVVALTETQTGAIAAATADQGLLIRGADRWYRFGEKEGLPAEQLIDIQSRAQHLWLTTSAGVFRAALPPLEAAGGHHLDFLPVVARRSFRGAHWTNCCRGKNDATAILANGAFVASTDDGVVIFDTEISTTSTMVPEPYIKSVSHSQQTFLPDADLARKLAADNEYLQIDYSAIELGRGDLVEFRYRLKGLSDEWIENGASRTVRFQKLAAGDYTFELQASSNPALWSATAASFAFSKTPHLLETTWIRSLMWMGSVLVMLGLVWLRMATVRHRHRQLETSIRQRTEELHGLNHQLQLTNSELQRASRTDPLTGLINRRFFDATHAEKRIAEQIGDTGLLAMIDIDFFKRVNDAYGHSAGDEVLCQFATVLRSVTRESDLVARWGGEEFLMICRCPNDDAVAVLDRISEAVRTHFFLLSDGHRVQLTCSMGAIRYPLWAGESVDERLPILLELADAALYAVKMNKRDGWALLEGGVRGDVKAHKVPVTERLQYLVEQGRLIWKASRPQIGPCVEDTVTRLRAIKNSR